jgi:hypothetical protein
MDNHQSHIDYKVVKFAKDNGIVLLTFPPHCSHALQPLDVTVFGPFKAGLKHSHNYWIQSHPGSRISIKEIASLCRIENTGVHPNRSVIPETRYAPASVTDRPGNGLFSSMNL